jgi:xylulokinase
MDPEGRIHTLCHAVPGLWHVMGATLSAGLSLQWLTQRVFRLEEEKGYDWLLEEARLSPPGANGILYLPYLLGERTPHMDDTATGAFLGLQFDHTRSDMVRAVLEGVLFSLLQAKDVIKSLGISSPNRLVMTGGASENALWRKLAADIFGIPVGRCTSRSGAAYGAAILASVGAGWFSDVSDAADSWVSVTDLVEPQLQYKSVYNEYYSMYKDAYPVLRHLYGKHRRNH